MTKCQGEDKNECAKKKTRTYLDSYLEFGFIEAMDRVRIECVICGEKLANESMKPCKRTRHQST